MKAKNENSMTIEQAFTTFPSLTTQHLHLREVQPSDAEALFAIKSDPEVTARYAQEPHRSLEDTHRWIQRLQDSYQQRDALFWCLTLKGNDRAIGGCTLWNLEPPGYHHAELGYELHPDYWGRGFITEANRALIDYGFRELDFHRIEACPLDENTASRRLLAKLGFSYEGNLRQRLFFRGEFKDQLYFSLLKEEWQKDD